MSSGANQSVREPWRLEPPFTTRTVVIVVIAALALLWTGNRAEMDRMLGMTGEAVLYSVGLSDDSQVVDGFGKIASEMLPIVIQQRKPTARIEGFNPDDLPPFAYLETEEVTEQRMDPESQEMVSTTATREYLVKPFGYATFVGAKMLETLEIALWGTIVAVTLSVPLAYFGASNYSPNRWTYFFARSSVSMFRAVPELISALFLVLAYGFGPIAGVLALGIHTAGFLGKFYAEDIENADRKPQEAMKAIGANNIKILWTSVLPQVLPQYIAYTLYILDRNVRMATVIGIVGAGGIGQELKGRYDMYDYDHVGTILLAIFITVLVLDQIAAALRRQAL